MRYRLPTLILLLCLAFTAQGAEANSQGSRMQLAQNDRQDVRARISSAQAASIAQQRHGGKVMNVSTQQRGNTVIYRVRILQDSGHMITVNVNGDSGSILN